MSQRDLLPDALTPPDWMERYTPEQMADRWPATLAEFVDVLAAVFRGRGRTEDDALADAQAAVQALGTHLGGRPVYLPRGVSLANALRDRAIWCAYPRQSIEQLARANGMTTRRIEQILAEQRAIVIRRIQPELFPTA